MADAGSGDSATSAPNPFTDLAAYARLPRLSGLAVSPDGEHLVTAVSSPGADATKFVTALWHLDPAGTEQPRRLTFSDNDESAPVFTPSGDLLFLSRRPNPLTTNINDDDDVASLWMLPAAGGEAREIASAPGGITAVDVARTAGDLVAQSTVMRSGDGWDREADAVRRRARKDAGVTAILHDTFPVRHWDHDLGPDVPVLLTAGSSGGGYGELRHVPAPDVGRIVGATPSPDGSVIAVEHEVPDGAAARRSAVTLIARSGGDVLLTLDEERTNFGSPAFSPDGTSVAVVRVASGDFESAPRQGLWLVDIGGGAGRDPTPALGLWPGEPVFATDGTGLFFAADERGHAPVFHADLVSGAVTRLTASGAYTDITVAPDGRSLYAMRSGYGESPTPVRLDSATTADQDPVALPSPGNLGALPGSVVEVATTAADGVPLRGWLVLPEGADAEHPAPLLLWIHGGPLSSWNSWSWRWNPWLMATAGWAVLLPDPALSTGYGQEFIQRGWGDWGAVPFADLMAITDHVVARDEVDDAHTAAMGGSFGGYMANWVATHTDRFAAIVTHASLWNLESFVGTTDSPWYWQRELGEPVTQPERYRSNSPHRYAENIRTPMLVVHGDKDYRVPIGQGLALWAELQRRGVPSQFLYYPTENHWVLTPGNATVWYSTVRAFLAHHVLGQKPRRPDLV